MAPLGTAYNPSAVMMGRSSTSPYLWSGPGSKPPMPSPAQTGGPTAIPPQPNPVMPSPARTGRNSINVPGAGTPPQAPAQSGTLGPEAIRATGTGPYDSAYRQNLATYAGGQFSRPGGSMNFNPTDPNTFPGTPTGGGSAPVAGMPNSLMDMALGGQSFSWTPPVADTTTPVPQTLQQWMQQWLNGGRGMRFSREDY